MKTFWRVAGWGFLLLEITFYWMSVYAIGVRKDAAAAFCIGMAIWMKLARREITK